MIKILKKNQRNGQCPGDLLAILMKVPGDKTFGDWGKNYFSTILSVKVDVFFNLSSYFYLVWFGYVIFVFLVKF